MICKLLKSGLDRDGCDCAEQFFANGGLALYLAARMVEPVYYVDREIVAYTDSIGATKHVRRHAGAYCRRSRMLSAGRTRETRRLKAILGRC